MRLILVSFGRHICGCMLWDARALHTLAIDGKELNKDVYILEGKERQETTTIGRGVKLLVD